MLRQTKIKSKNTTLNGIPKIRISLMKKEKLKKIVNVEVIIRQGIYKAISIKNG